MINEEKILSSHLGKDNHFKVPEGYFDHLMEQVMEKLPEQEAQVIDIKHRPLATWWKQPAIRKIAAAVALVALLGGGATVALHHQPAHQPASVAQAESTHSESMQTRQTSNEDATFDEMANYTMMDNETIYASLIAEN